MSKSERGMSGNQKDWAYGILFLIGWVLLAVGISALVGYFFGVRWY